MYISFNPVILALLHKQLKHYPLWPHFLVAAAKDGVQRANRKPDGTALDTNQLYSQH